MIKNQEGFSTGPSNVIWIQLQVPMFWYQGSTHVSIGFVGIFGQLLKAKKYFFGHGNPLYLTINNIQVYIKTFSYGYTDNWFLCGRS